MKSRPIDFILKWGTVLALMLLCILLGKLFFSAIAMPPAIPPPVHLIRIQIDGHLALLPIFGTNITVEVTP